MIALIGVRPAAIQAATAAEETPWWVLLIVLGGFLVLVVALAAGRNKTVTPTQAEPAWKANARNGYAEARWLSDNLTESLAIWHGDAAHGGGAGSGATDAGNQRIWDQAASRRQRATDELYALEAAATPGSPAVRSAQRTITAVNDVYAGVTERSDAREAYRSAADADEADAAAVATARDREVRASAKVTKAREELAAALGELAAIA